MVQLRPGFFRRLGAASAVWLALGGPGGAGSAVAAPAPLPPAPEFELRFVHPSRTVYSLALDRAGFLWIGTEADLLRGDGIFFDSRRAGAPLPVSNPRVFRLAGTTDGSMWVGLGGGLTRFENGAWNVDESGADFGLLRLHDGGWHDDPISAIAGAGKPWMIWSMMAAADGALWFGEGQCLRRFANQRLTSYCQPEGHRGAMIFALTPDGDGRPLVGGPLGVQRFSGERLVDEALNEAVNVLLREPSGRIWAGTGTGLVAIENRAVVARFTTADGLASNAITALARSADGTLWVGTQAGLFRLRSGRIDNGGFGTALSDVMILSLLEDPAGSLWIGTRTMGLARLSRRSIHNIGEREGLGANDVRAILRGRAAPGAPLTGSAPMWITTSHGLSRVHGTTIENFRPPAKWGPTTLCSLAQDERGTLFISTTCPPVAGTIAPPGPSGQGGLVIFRDQSWHRFTTAQGLPRDDPNMVLIDRTGDLWLGWKTGGLARIRRAALTADHLGPADVTTIAAPGICAAPIGSGLHDRHGGHWFTAEGGGVIRLRRDQSAVCFTSKDGLPNLASSTVVEGPDGTIWVGSRIDGGVSRFLPGPSGTRGRFETFATAHGLACDTTHEIVPESKQLWSTCRGGVARTALSEFDRGRRLSSGAAGLPPLPMQSIAFGAAEGMRVQETAYGSHPSAARAPDGRLWVATPAGIAIIEAPPDAVSESAQPRVAIESLTVNGLPLPTRAAADLRGDQAAIRIRLATPAFAAPNRLSFAYRIDGRHTGWQLSRVPIRDLDFPDLTPGRYTLRVRTSDGAGGWSPHEATLAIRLRPFLYKTPLFQLACVLALAGLVLAVVRARAHRITMRHAAIQEERARIARDLHDEIGQSYASLGLHLDALKLALREAPQATLDLFERFRAILDQARGETRRSIWRLRSATLDEAPLDETLRAIVKQQRAALGRGAPEIVLRISGAPFAPLPQIDHELTQIAREAISNSINHAAARRIVVDLDQSPVGIRLKVTDDGKGMLAPTPELAAQGHFGIVGMQERAIRAGARVQVHSAPGAGTEVVIAAPARSART